MKLVVVGGVAGGMSAATRARRLNEHAEIVVFEAGEYVSFANCGLPYHLAGEIEERDALLLHTPESLARRAALDVRINSKVTSIDRENKTVTVAGPEGEYTESYDKLILSPGSVAVQPPIPGIDHPAVSTLRTIPEMDYVIKLAEDGAEAAKQAGRSPRAVVIGAGFIGLEAVEALVHRGFEVDLVEFADHVLPVIDGDLAVLLHRELRAKGVGLHLGVAAQSFRDGDERAVTVALSSGEELEADLVITSIGVRPNSKLAEEAGLELGERGAIVVDENQFTSDPNILAAGDAVEVKFHDGRRGSVMLAGPANRQGRRAADAAMGYETIKQQPVLGTAGVRVFDLVAAATGSTSAALEKAGIEHFVVHLHSGHHAGYYPGATPIHLNAAFSKDGRLLGAQAVGENGVARRIDILATAIRAGMTAEDLAELELTYSPPLGTAKDIINMLGFTVQNILFEDCPIWDWEEFEEIKDKYLILDVRPTKATEGGRKLDEAVNIPFLELRDRIDEVRELANGRPIALHCKTGLTAYLSQRTLQQEGFEVKNFTGGYDTIDLKIEAFNTNHSKSE
ncbi:MAG: FAD-dependent oxidoreductase [Actinomycetaceae bacterium]|nr:FAD-dependent oxidoreductase [Actinomycetaceae bacterium]